MKNSNYKTQAEWAREVEELRRKLKIVEEAIGFMNEIYSAKADGEEFRSCCDGKHFKQNLSAGDVVCVVYYPYADRFREVKALSALRGEGGE